MNGPISTQRHNRKNLDFNLSLSSGLKLAAAAAPKFFQSPLAVVVVRQPANGEILAKPAHKPITQSKFETFCLADLSERYENINNFINYIKKYTELPA